MSFVGPTTCRSATDEGRRLQRRVRQHRHLPPTPTFNRRLYSASSRCPFAAAIAVRLADLLVRGVNLEFDGGARLGQLVHLNAGPPAVLPFLPPGDHVSTSTSSELGQPSLS